MGFFIALFAVWSIGMALILIVERLLKDQLKIDLGITTNKKDYPSKEK